MPIQLHQMKLVPSRASFLPCLNPRRFIRRHLPGRRALFHYLLWLSIGSVCLCGFTYQAFKSFEAFFNYPYEVLLFEKRSPADLLFPSVTLCPDIWFDSQAEFCKSEPRACTPNGQMITIGSYHFQNNATIRHLTRFASRDLFNCKMISSRCPSFDCIDFMKPSYFRQPRMQCYTMDLIQFLPKLHAFHQCRDIWSYRLEMSSSWDSRAVRIAADVLDTAVFVQCPGFATPVRQSVVEIPPGKNLRVGVRQLVTEKLQAPFPSMCRSYEGFGPEFFGQESREFCTQKCIIFEEMNLCGCVLNLHEYAETTVDPSRICNMFLASRCFQQVYNADVAHRCQKHCNVNCRDVSYDVKVWSLRDLDGGTERVTTDENLTTTKKIHENGYRLRLEFYSDRIEFSQEQALFSGVELFGLLGGYAGMWIGLSLRGTFEYISEGVINRS